MTRDLRKYSRQTNIRLYIGFFLILFIVGDGLIYFFYGRDPAIFGMLCLLAGSAPLLLVVIILWVMDLIVERANKE